MISAHLRRTVRALYAFACGYCGITETEAGSQLTIDHYQPKDAGGSDDIANLVYACHACNLLKSAAWNPLNAPVLHPLRSDMNDHIRLLPDSILQGLTPEGTRHIETLHLNRVPLVAHRKIRRVMEAIFEREERLRAQDTLEDQEIHKKQRMIRRSRRR